jgi:hypothetical protein
MQTNNAWQGDDRCGFETTKSPRAASRRQFEVRLAAAALAGFVAIAWSDRATAAMHRVGPGRSFTTLEAAINGNTWAPGDTIQLDAGRFDVRQMLRPLGSGASGRPIVVRGAGAGQTIVSGSALADTKALWDVEQSNRWWVFEDMTVAQMRGAQTNARGFFLVGCEDVVVQRCEVMDCWNGFMSASGANRVTVQFCDVHDNGGLQGPAHNFYMSGGSNFVIRSNWIHDAQYGTCYKDRTHNLQLLYNRIENAAIEGYEVSLAGDGSGAQGDALLMGNLIVKSPSSSQQTHLVRFEDGRGGTLTMIHNTIIGQPRNVLVSSIASQTTLHNNILYGGATVFSGGALTGKANWLANGRSVGGLTASVQSSLPGFMNSSGGDYHLAQGSACIDAADASVVPRPIVQWRPLPGFDTRGTIGRGPDIGAFESIASTSPVTPATWSGVKARYR